MNKKLIAIYTIALSLVIFTRCSEDDIVADQPGIQSNNVQSAYNDPGQGSSNSNARAVTGKYIPKEITGTINGILFTAELRITKFVAERNTLYAIGTLNNIAGEGLPAAVANLSGQQIKIPAQRQEAAGAAVTAAAVPACDILFLQLGPLDLDLLGLVIHLDQITLDIDAQSGSGNLLGNLLCAVTGLLDGAGALAGVAQLLNQIIDLIGVLS